MQATSFFARIICPPPKPHVLSLSGWPKVYARSAASRNRTGNGAETEGFAAGLHAIGAKHYSDACGNLRR